MNGLTNICKILVLAYFYFNHVRLLNNMFEYLDFNYEDVKKEAGVFIVSFYARDLEDSEGIISGSIIMKLKEGTDFVMSFSLD